MAQTGRDIKRRMNTIRSIQQITKAMEMVAASKLRQAQKSAEATRPYFARLQQSLSRALAAAERVGEELPPIARSRQGDRHCLVVVTSERGLAGGYNANILRRASEFTGSIPNRCWSWWGARQETISAAAIGILSVSLSTSVITSRLGRPIRLGR